MADRALYCGSNTDRRVFKVKFHYPLSSKVRYEVVDNTLGKANFPFLSTTRFLNILNKEIKS